LTTDPETVNWPPGWQVTRDAAAGTPVPSVCRVVCWVDTTNQRPWPAFIVKVNDDGTVDLTVFNPLPQYFKGVKYDPDGTTGGTWHWPPRT
jgi:hypothetical protein